jgi:PAS domain S-box-containing protein
MTVNDVDQAQETATADPPSADAELRSLFDDAPLPYHEIDRNGLVVRVNRAECELLGIEAADMIGKPVWDFASPQERERSRASVARKFAEGRARPPYERHYRTHSGEDRVFQMHERMVVGRNGEITGIRTAMLDLTEVIHSRRQVEFQAGLLEQVRDAIVTVDTDFKVTYCNPAALRLLRWSRDEAIGQDYAALTGTSFTRAGRSAILARIAASGEWKSEVACKTRDGVQVLTEVFCSALHDADGNMQGVVGIHRDITARKRVESRLRATEDRLTLAQTAMDIGSWELDLKTGKIKASERLLQLYGFPPDREELTSEEWSGRLHPEDRSRMIAHVGSIPARGGALDQQYRVRWPDGAVRWLHGKAHLLRDADGRATKIIGIDFDITDLKTGQRANAELAAVVAAAEVGIVSLDLFGNVLTWNAGAERIFGYSAEEMIGRSIAILVPEDRLRELDSLVIKLRHGESLTRFETVRVTKSGTHIHVLLCVAPIRDRNGAVTGAADIITDVTETRLLQRQLGQAQKLEAIGQLAAGIAHEINTPIQYIGDNGRFLQDAFRDFLRLIAPYRELPRYVPNSALPAALVSTLEEVRDIDADYLRDEVPKAIEQLLEGVDHVARIVRAMKEFSHPGSVEKAPADLNRAIESTIMVSRNEWKHVAELTTSLDADLPLVPCVAGEINQVLLNLIINSAQAVSDVVRDTGRRGAIHVTSRQNGEWAEIRVRDTGTGIPPAIQSRIFDPFFTTKDVGKGTGQGLSLAHAVIVQKHHGRIHFETCAGEGTTFIVQLPLRDPEAQA